VANSILTIAIEVPDGVHLQLGSKITVQGHEVDCLTINFARNCILQADALEQRLDVALAVLEDNVFNGLDDYNSRLEELEELDELLELQE
jgi:hypothetical protein